MSNKPEPNIWTITNNSVTSNLSGIVQIFADSLTHKAVELATFLPHSTSSIWRATPTIKAPRGEWGRLAAGIIIGRHRNLGGLELVTNNNDTDNQAEAEIVADTIEEQ